MIYCGLYQMDITPALGMEIPGYFCVRHGSGIREPLYCQAAYFEDENGGKAVLVTMDSIIVPRGLTPFVRKELSEKLSVAPECVMTCATHTHLGGPVETWGEFTHENPEYIAFLSRRALDCAVLAEKAKRPVKIGVGFGKEYSVGHIRDFVTPDGVYHTNSHLPGQKEVGKIDPDVGVLRIDNADGTAYGLIANYACHCDSVGGDMLSSDYPGAMRDTLRKTYGADFMPLFVNGFNGNINHIDFDHDTHKVPNYYRQMGRVLAAEVSRTYEKIAVSDDYTFGGAEEIFDVPRRLPMDYELAWAKQVPADAGVQDSFYRDEMLKFQTEGPRSLEADVQVLKLGPILVCGMPGEIYSDYAYALKEQIDAPLFTANLANHSIGYLTSRQAFNWGIYSARLCTCAWLSPDSGDTMTASCVRSAEKLLK